MSNEVPDGEKRWWTGVYGDLGVEPPLALPKELIEALSNGISWSEYLTDLYQLADASIELPDIGVLNIIDENGCPTGMPMHYEFKNDRFYFVTNAAAKRNENLTKNSGVSLLIYYKALNQSTVLVKGRATATSIQYQFNGADKSHTQILYELVPHEVNISFLDDSNRYEQEVKRHLYTYTDTNGGWSQSSQRVISIQNDLEDVIDRMVTKDRAWLAPMLPTS